MEKKDKTPATPTTLEQELAQCKGDYAELEKKYGIIVIDLTNANDANAKLDALLKLEQKRTAALEEEIAELKNLIDELQEEVEDKDNSSLITAGTPTVKHEGEVYEIHAPSFKFEGEDYTIADLKDPALVGRLIALEVGFLVKV